MSFKTFDEVISYMDNPSRPQGRSVRSYRLDRMKAIMERLGNPQDSIKTLHIAGSKGKGSTSSYLAAAIHALGYKTGLYLSPHVSDYRERFTINGSFALDADLIKCGNILEEKLKNFTFVNEDSEDSPTTFELYTAFAFLLFYETNCKWAVIETGLGGRLDATNILKPQASILTPIELEHTELLGNTIKEIAGEKAKIIKPDTPSFMSFQNPEAKKVFEDEAETQNSVLTELEKEIVCLETETKQEKQLLHLQLKDGYNNNLKLSMLGDVQAYNCALAICTLRKLGLYKKDVTEQALEKNRLPGRMEKIVWDRPLYIDGAHTENSICHLVKSFKAIYPNTDSLCIFGCLTGKNAEAMGRIILDNFTNIIICKPGDYKKSNPTELFNLFMKMKTTEQNIYIIEDPGKALNFSKQITKKENPILICGSFYLAGAIKETLCL